MARKHKPTEHGSLPAVRSAIPELNAADPESDMGKIAAVLRYACNGLERPGLAAAAARFNEILVGIKLVASCYGGVFSTFKAMPGTAVLVDAISSSMTQDAGGSAYIGACPRCGRIFEKRRADQLYDRETCQKEFTRKKRAVPNNGA